MNPGRIVTHLFFWTLIASSGLASGCLSPLAGPDAAPGLTRQSVETAAQQPRPNDANEVSSGAANEVPGDARAVPIDLEGPLTLKDLQGLARRQNPQAGEIHARLAAAEARVKQARSGYYPSLTTEGNFLARENEVSFSDPNFGNIVVSDQFNYTHLTSLNYNLWDWGTTRFRYQASQQDRDRERAESERALQTLDFQVAQSFFTVHELNQDIVVLEASVEQLEGALKLARDLKEVGRTTEADVLVVGVNLERGKFNLRRIEDALVSAREALAVLLNHSLDAEIELKDPEAYRTTLAEIADIANPERMQRAEELAEQFRPELRALQSAMLALESSAKSERGEYLPAFGVFVQHQYSVTESAFLDPDFFSAGVAAQWEIFSGFRTESRINELREQVRGLRHRLVGTLSDITLEVRRSIRTLRRAVDGVEVADKSVVQAQENLRRLTEMFRGGKATGQELLEAESLLRSESARRVRAYFTVYRAHAALRLSTGVDYDQEIDFGLNLR